MQSILKALHAVKHDRELFSAILNHRNTRSRVADALGIVAIDDMEQNNTVQVLRDNVANLLRNLQCLIICDNSEISKGYEMLLKHDILNFKVETVSQYRLTARELRRF